VPAILLRGVSCRKIKEGGHITFKVKMRTLLAVLGLSLTACTRSVGHAFDIRAADRLKPGISTLEDAVSALGPYSGGGRAGAPVKVYDWSYYYRDAVTGKWHIQVVYLGFGPDGRLRDRKVLDQVSKHG
jgi:hypothetical protein